MKKITQQPGTLVASPDQPDKDSLVEKLVEISLKYARGKSREAYVKIRKPSKKELERGIWREDDCIFLEQDIELECLRLCTELADKLEQSVDEAIHDHLDDDDEYS
jgi:hypothetical protein